MTKDKRIHNPLTCKYCGETFTVLARPEDLDEYLRCCKTCWENDEPGMARFARMQEAMGTTFAITHG